MKQLAGRQRPVTCILMSNENAPLCRCAKLWPIKYCAKLSYLYALIAFWRIQKDPKISFKCFLFVSRSTRNNFNTTYRKTCLKRTLRKKTKMCFQDRLSLNAGQKYCRMLQCEHSAIRSTFIKLTFVIKIFVLSIFEWPLKTGSTVHEKKSGRTVWIQMR